MTAVATAAATVARTAGAPAPTVSRAPVAPARPGRQRSEAADHAILAAALDVLAADGYGGFTMSAVIARAGVSSATLYRRWQTKQDLVMAALEAFSTGDVEVDTGSLAGDVERLVRDVADVMSLRRDDVADAVCLELRRNAEFSDAIHERMIAPRLASVQRVLDRARRRGELGPGLSAAVAMSLVSGPVHHRAVVLGLPVTPAFLRSVSTAALAALQALAPVAPAS